MKALNFAVIDIDLFAQKHFRKPCVELPEGFVRFNRKALTIEVNGGRYTYEINLESCKTPGQMLDWIFQLLGKTWMTPALMWDLLHTFNEACQAVFGSTVQGCLCPGGSSQRIDWRKRKVDQ